MPWMRRLVLDGGFVSCSALALALVGAVTADPISEPIFDLGLDDREISAPGGTLLLDVLRIHAPALAAGTPDLVARSAAAGLALTALRLLTAYAALGFADVPKPRRLAQAFILGGLSRIVMGLVVALGFDWATRSAAAWIESPTYCLGVLGLGLVTLSGLRTFDSLVVLEALGSPECPRFFEPLKRARARFQTKPGILLALTASLGLGGAALAFLVWALGLSLMKGAPPLASLVLSLSLVAKVSFDLAYQRALVASTGSRTGRPAEEVPWRS